MEGDSYNSLGTYATRIWKDPWSSLIKSPHNAEIPSTALRGVYPASAKNLRIWGTHCFERSHFWNTTMIIQFNKQFWMPSVRGLVLVAFRYFFSASRICIPVTYVYCQFLPQERKVNKKWSKSPSSSTWEPRLFTAVHLYVLVICFCLFKSFI